MQLERMDAFFDARTPQYEEHMLRNIVGADAFYPETARLLAPFPEMRLLDLGCGTGLELDAAFALCSQIHVTGIDLSRGMLARLRQKPYADRLTLIHGSYFDVPFGQCAFDRAVSVESLHHFSAVQKTALYQKIHAALIPGGYYVETDYVAKDASQEEFFFSECARLRREQNLPKDEFFHYDTPHTVDNLHRMMLEAGFTQVEHVYQIENTAILIAKKEKES